MGDIETNKEFYDVFKNLKGSEELELIIDPGTASPEQIGELLSEISSLYKMLGGEGIEFRPEKITAKNLLGYER